MKPLTRILAATDRSSTQPGWSLHEIAVMVFLFITAPVTAHLLAKAALHRRGGHDGKHREEIK